MCTQIITKTYYNGWCIEYTLIWYFPLTKEWEVVKRIEGFKRRGPFEMNFKTRVGVIQINKKWMPFKAV